MIEVLLKAGADPTIKNNLKETPQSLIHKDYETASKILTEARFHYLLDQSEYDASYKEVERYFQAGN